LEHVHPGTKKAGAGYFMRTFIAIDAFALQGGPTQMKAITIATFIAASIAGISFAQAAGTYSGHGKVCITKTAGSTTYDCRFASMEQCTKEGQPNGQACDLNPNLGTTGQKPKK
jgi:hypothetical protein